MPIRLLAGLMFCVLPGICLAAQTGGAETSGKAVEKPVTDAGGQLVEENQYFRVFRQEIASGATAKVDQHGRDTVVLPLASGLTLSTHTNPPVEFKDEEARFVPAGSAPRIVSSATSPVPLLVMELKQHWDAVVRACSEPARCTHPIRMGETAIGETTSLFTNGFVTAYQHRLDRGGTLSSAYFSSKGRDHLLLIALTDLQANFDGSDETLMAGETYASEATGIEVNATKAPVRWVVIRVETPKNKAP